MSTTLENAVAMYLRSGNPAQRTREEYSTTLRKWARWGSGVPLETLGRKEIREFLDWVHEAAAAHNGKNPGRTANKVRSHLRAVMSWAWEQDIVDALPRFPKFQFRTFDRSSCERCEVSEEVEIIFALCRVERHCR
jgi:hypothetical protein